jgi:hypothetical protein
MGGVTQPDTLGRRRCDRQVFQLRCETPAEAIGQALGQLSAGELRAPSRHLAATTRQWLDPLLAPYLFATTAGNRLRAITDVESIAEQKALERAGFRREGIMRGLAFDRGRWQGGVLYARLRDDSA